MGHYIMGHKYMPTYLLVKTMEAKRENIEWLKETIDCRAQKKRRNSMW